MARRNLLCVEGVTGWDCLRSQELTVKSTLRHHQLLLDFECEVFEAAAVRKSLVLFKHGAASKRRKTWSSVFAATLILFTVFDFNVF